MSLWLSILALVVAVGHLVGHLVFSREQGGEDKAETARIEAAKQRRSTLVATPLADRHRQAAAVLEKLLEDPEVPEYVCKVLRMVIDVLEEEG